MRSTDGHVLVGCPHSPPAAGDTFRELRQLCGAGRRYHTFYDWRMTVRVGLCGFTMAMADYALHFPVVEIQHTFYEPPNDDVMRRWLAVTPSSLEFTMKVWQLVTHSAASPTYRRMKRQIDPAAEPGFFRASSAVEEGWQRSLRCAGLLSATAMLFQSPASFTPSPEHVDGMRRFFERIERPRARLLWEPRGPAWVRERELAVALCRDLQLVHVVDPFVTTPERGSPVYYRLHGISGPRHSYSDAELRQLRAIVAGVDSDEPAYVMFNNLPRAANARAFLRLIDAT
jgi:uncharacterized protein YecE (DUF72 family)